jgi:hypothetical protein
MCKIPRQQNWQAFCRYGASQFSRYLPGTVGDLDRDKNARPGITKLIKKTFRAFLAPFERRELRRRFASTSLSVIALIRIRASIAHFLKAETFKGAA